MQLRIFGSIGFDVPYNLAINGYLDKLEKELITKLQEAGDSAKGQVMELVATLAENEKEILEYQDNLL
jgi:hypothetical protein